MSELEAPEEIEETLEAAAAPPAVKKIAAADDPRAVAGIRRAKGFGGLAGFGVTALAAQMHGELAASILLRALLGGIIGYMVGWLAAVVVWRRIIRAELHHGSELLASDAAAGHRSAKPELE